jgi:hypothetical protein
MVLEEIARESHNVVIGKSSSSLRIAQRKEEDEEQSSSSPPPCCEDLNGRIRSVRSYIRPVEGPRGTAITNIRRKEI